MFRRTLLLGHFLRDVAGTEPFADYCRTRGVPFRPAPAGDPGGGLSQRWREAVATLPPERQADIELELAQVNDLACRDSVYHLIDVCGEQGLPSDLVPGEAAQALWFLVHRPSVFQEVFFHEEVLESDSWRNAQAPPGLAIGDLSRRHTGFERELSRFFRAAEGTGRFCATRGYRLHEPDRLVFVGHVSDRLRLLDAFSDDGEHRRQTIRPASRVIFAYYPCDGALLLKARCRAREKVLALMGLFCRAVLGCTFDEAGLGASFDLDRLKRPFDPPLPPGVLKVRVKSLELAYPAAEGRRRVRLETSAADGPSAVPQLLAVHVAETELRRLRVACAELQVTLGVRGRPKDLFVRLWPDRCSLNQTPASEAVRQCLRAWGLTHATQP